jgi:predicted RNase H-like HicB family nuclease
LDEALTNSQEAILLHLEGLLDDGMPLTLMPRSKVRLDPGF